MIKRLWGNWIARGLLIGSGAFAALIGISGAVVFALNALGALGAMLVLLAIVCLGMGLLISSEF